MGLATERDISSEHRFLARDTCLNQQDLPNEPERRSAPNVNKIWDTSIALKSCHGARGVGRFVGTGLFQVFNGTFNGYGSLNITTGTFSGDGTCNGTDSTFFSLSKSTYMTGDGTVQGNGSFLVPSGTFVGSGEFKGSAITYYGGEATFQATFGKAVGNHTVTGKKIECETSSFGEYVGQGTADGTGQLVGNGALDSEDGEFTGTGTFTGIGDCEGATFAAY